MREFLSQEIEGSRSLERLLDAIYGADRVTKGNGSYVARIDPALRKGMTRVSKRDRVTLNAIIEAALTRYLSGRRRSPRHADLPPTETK